MEILTFNQQLLIDQKTMEEKKCTVCGITQNLQNFHCDKRNKDGKRSKCKKCACEDARKRNIDSKEKISEYRTKNKIRIQETRRAYREAHKEERRKQYNEWYEKNKEYRKQYSSDYVFRKYGIDRNDYKKLLSYQNGVCAICGNDNKGKRLFVDHDHQTNDVRGLLCTNCNTAIGLMMDSTTILQNAIVYLSRGRSDL